MKKLLLFLLALSFSSYVFAGLTGYTKNITGDGKIEITYTLEADNEDETLPVFAIDFSAEIPGKKKPYIPRTVEGEGKTGIVIGPGTYKLVWDAKKDRKKNDPGAIIIKFDVKDVTDKAKYLCLDLKKNKMRYQSDAPNEIGRASCRERVFV